MHEARRRCGVWRAAWLFAALVAAFAGRPPTSHAQTASAPDTVAAPDTTTAVQRDLMDLLHRVMGRSVVLEPPPPPRRGISRSLLPSLGYNPNAGLSLGASVGLGGWLGDPATTRLSSAIVSATYSTEGQTSVQFKSNFVLPDNNWVLLGDWRYLNTNQPTYGFGPTSPDQSEYPMKFMLYRLHQVASRQVQETALSIGLGYYFDRYTDIRDTRAAQGEATPYSVYSGGTPTHSQSSGVSMNLNLDTRDNQINAHRGVYWDLSLQYYRPWMGSDAAREAMWSDFRAYTRLPRGSRNVLAAWTYLWWTSGTSPYLDLPAIGWDTYGRGGRGYVQGRMRGANQSYAEVEYRMRLSPDDLVGVVAFVNLTGTTLAQGTRVGTPDLGFGGGLRLKLNKRTNSNVAFDVGRGDDGETRVFVALNEAY